MSEKERKNKKDEKKYSEILANYECDGQMSVYDFPEWLPEPMKANGRSVLNQKEGEI